MPATQRHTVQRLVLLLAAGAVLHLLLLWVRNYFRVEALDLRLNFSTQPDGRFLWSAPLSSIHCEVRRSLPYAPS